jgi:hypothetical protein
MAGKKVNGEKSMPLGMRHHHTLIVYLKAHLFIIVLLIPAILKHLTAFLYGWLPYLMPKGISIIKSNPTPNINQSHEEEDKI